MEFEFFIGIDVSKNELDFAVQKGKQLLFHKEIANQPDAINIFIKELRNHPGFNLIKAVFCMEHTGIYNNHALACLHQKKAHICLEAATQIKMSLGNLRGKNDKVDAIRIAEYAYTKRDRLCLWEPRREIVQQLTYLATTRTRLVEAKKMLKTPLQETSNFINRRIAKQNESVCLKTLNAIESDLIKVEKIIENIIAADQELKRLFSLVISVSGIGHVTAAQILIVTNEFNDISDPKQFACYSGVAPFTHESGKVKKKARVSHMANKKMKMLLHLAALAAIRYNPDLKTYYERMVTKEKKNKMSVINAVRNKLILRIFACVKQNRFYENNYTRLVA